MPAFYPYPAIYSHFTSSTPMRAVCLKSPVPRGTSSPLARLVRRLVLHTSCRAAVQNFWLNFTPSQRPALLVIRPLQQTWLLIISVLSSTPLPGFKGGDFITTTGSSATLQNISPSLSLPLSGNIFFKNSTGLPRLISGPCERSHPQSLMWSVRVPGITLFCRLAHHTSRIWFAYAMYRSLPITSFRPFRYQKRPCDSD